MIRRLIQNMVFRRLLPYLLQPARHDTGWLSAQFWETFYGRVSAIAGDHSFTLLVGE